MLTRRWVGPDETGQPPILRQGTLANGLRVVLAPDRSAPVVAVVVTYGVGTRSEAPGRAGFAHLFEHLMFQGDAPGATSGHARSVHEAGGTANAATHLDFTEFHEVLPAEALERALFLEAQRMRSPAIDETSLRAQIAVVAREAQDRVGGLPYGGFPEERVPPVLFDTFANSHDGYGTTTELSTATESEAIEFFAEHYGPGRAVLTVAGDFDLDETRSLIDRHFGDIPAHGVTSPPTLTEPGLSSSRRTAYVDPLAPLPAFAMAWRAPDPVKDRRRYLAHVVMVGALSGGPAARLRQRLQSGRESVVGVVGRVGMPETATAIRDPSSLVIHGIVGDGGDLSAVCDAIQEEVGSLAAHGPGGEGLARTKARLTTGIFVGLDHVLDRARQIGACAQVHRRPLAAMDLVGWIDEVDETDVMAAAADIASAPRSVVEVLPGAG